MENPLPKVSDRSSERLAKKGVGDVGKGFLPDWARLGPTVTRRAGSSSISQPAAEFDYEDHTWRIHCPIHSINLLKDGPKAEPLGTKLEIGHGH